jgi:hypothetical protein
MLSRAVPSLLAPVLSSSEAIAFTPDQVSVLGPPGAAYSRMTARTPATHQMGPGAMRARRVHWDENGLR